MSLHCLIVYYSYLRRDLPRRASSKRTCCTKYARRVELAASHRKAMDWARTVFRAACAMCGLWSAGRTCCHWTPNKCHNGYSTRTPLHHVDKSSQLHRRQRGSAVVRLQVDPVALSPGFPPGPTNRIGWHSVVEAEPTSLQMLAPPGLDAYHGLVWNNNGPAPLQSSAQFRTGSRHYRSTALTASARQAKADGARAIGPPRRAAPSDNSAHRPPQQSAMVLWP